ncbi:response regulator transcription factor [Algoriphagus boritolerans]|uniref:response regulator n=1 Tax=Algoriphagus boritolerans TaxID=308111 RepID=UPI000AD3728A
MNPTRILLADDHELVRDGIKSLLENEPEFTVVAEASDGKEALKLIGLDQPDLLIVDIRMPQMNGIEVVKNLTKSFPKVKKTGFVHARFGRIRGGVHRIRCRWISPKGQQQGGIYQSTSHNRRRREVFFW